MVAQQIDHWTINFFSSLVKSLAFCCHTATPGKSFTQAV